jgi:hypothetical protein
MRRHGKNLMAKITELTPAQSARLLTFRAEWLNW